MGKEIIFKLPYRDEGKDRIINIKIDFFSIGIARDLDELSAKQFKILEEWDELKKLGQKIVDIKKEKPEGYKAEIKQLKEKVEDCKNEILSFGNNVFLEEQHKLIQQILKNNKITDGILTTHEFWDYCVDVEDLGKFLYAVSHKDDYLKKKQ